MYSHSYPSPDPDPDSSYLGVAAALTAVVHARRAFGLFRPPVLFALPTETFFPLTVSLIPLELPLRSRLNVRHELSHMLDHGKYGDDYYELFTPARREQMVLERLKINRI